MLATQGTRHVPTTNSISRLRLVYCHSPSMDEGTELVEAYGEHQHCGADSRLPLQIRHHRCVAAVEAGPSASTSSRLRLTPGESGTGKSCLLYQCIHETCESLLCAAPEGARWCAGCATAMTACAA